MGMHRATATFKGKRDEGRCACTRELMIAAASLCVPTVALLGTRSSSITTKI